MAGDPGPDDRPDVLDTLVHVSWPVGVNAEDVDLKAGTMRVMSNGRSRESYRWARR